MKQQRRPPCTDFSALCGVGATLAGEAGHPVLVSWTAELPRVRVAEQIRRLPAEPGRTFVWASAWSGHRRVAIGTALDLTGWGAARFDQVSAAWSAARDGALVGGTGRRPSLVGGFSFTEAATDPVWPPALMWLPAAELSESPGRPRELTLNAWLHPGEPRDDAVLRAGAAARTLLSETPVVDTAEAHVVATHEEPSEAEWKRLARLALDAIAAGRFDSVMLARALAVDVDRPVSASAVLGALIDRHRVGAVFGAQLGERWFLGQSPQCLLHLHDGRADSHVLAGADTTLDRAHGLAVDDVVARLRRFFRDVRTDASTPLLELADAQHRQTGILATRPTQRADLLRLAGALHPTPAVGGVPSASALPWLADHEPLQRGWYTAPIGWLGANGEGELAVGLRASELHGTTAVVHAGSELVTGSSPDEEYDVTRAALRQLLTELAGTSSHHHPSKAIRH